MLDTKLIEEIKKLADDKVLFAQFLSQTRKSISGNRDGYDAEMASLKQKINENENSIKALVNTIAKGTGGAAEQYIMDAPA